MIVTQSTVQRKICVVQMFDSGISFESKARDDVFAPSILISVQAQLYYSLSLCNCEGKSLSLGDIRLLFYDAYFPQLAIRYDFRHIMRNFLDFAPDAIAGHIYVLGGILLSLSISVVRLHIA